MKNGNIGNIGNIGKRPLTPALAACLALLLSLVLLPLALAGCGASQPGVLDQILAAGSLAVIVPENAGEYARLGSDGVTWEGSEIELARAVADRIGVALSVRAVPKGQLLAEISNGAAQMAIGRIAFNDSLPRNYAVSAPYADGRLYAVAPRGALFPTAGSLQGRKVGVTDQLSENALIAVNRVEGITIDTYPDAQLVEGALVGGLAAAYLCYGDQAFALAGSEALQAQNIALGELDESYVIVCPRGAGALLAPINEAIAAR
ncbi:MAG: transporter substrate-binding domain-containing protein [Clostridiales bacterium]|jgi:polar amino acid transport system substrate-binding protein|nr:transporter substrate-binding domain-containing protein [Clostridiales bacterium]